jgi:site-specific DNA-methyltransferase (adenine-specific)
MNRLLRGDALELLPTLPAESVHLVVTSPPYNVAWDYGDGGQGDQRPLPSYLAFLGEALVGCYRALRPGGVLALNLPPTIRQPGHRAYPLAAWATMHLQETGWLLREPIVWLKAQQDGRPYASGTAIGAPSNPYLRPTHELVLLASKGDYRLPHKATWPQEGPYVEWLKDVWLLPPGRAKAGEPLAFPDELVRRLVLLFSEPGGVVLDPFAGTGTVGRVAMLHGRTAWLIEREPAYWPRLEAIIGQGVLLAAVSDGTEVQE